MIPKSLTDLILFQECRKFIIVVYRLTRLLPDDERFGLTSQVKRATVSVLANIVEGYGRNSTKDQLHFYNIALASFREVECYLLVFLDLKYITKENYLYLSKTKDKVGGLLVNFIKSKKG